MSLPPPGPWLGGVFAVVMFGGIFLWSFLHEERRRRRWEREHPEEPGLAGHLRSRIVRLIRPTLLLIPAKQPGFSKLGGDPELAEGMGWPSDEDGPRTFLAQIDLGAFRPHGGPDWLPMEGRFSAFYNPDRNGCADMVRILYSTDPSGPPTQPPPGAKWRYPERRVAFMLLNSAPSVDWLGVDWFGLDLDIEDFHADIAELVNTPPPDELQQRIGGYPDEIQNGRMPLECEHIARGLPPPNSEADVPPAIERACRQWRLLMQIDSDPALQMNFFGGGRLYIFIREQHARKGDFSKTVTLAQFT